MLSFYSEHEIISNNFYRFIRHLLLLTRHDAEVCRDEIAISNLVNILLDKDSFLRIVKLLTRKLNVEIVNQLENVYFGE